VDRELVVRARGGDRDAFSALAAASIGWLFDLAQLMLADPDLAQDAVQEALVVGWRDLRGLRDAERFDAWMRRVLVRCVYREAHQRRRGHVARLDLIGDIVPASSREASLEDRDELDRSFARLPVEHRAVLVLHHYLGLPDQEAADTLRIPLGTFKSRLHRATSALRAELEAVERGAPLATARHAR
jgi:RNA polymerase sigma factor (sigma-70 family)